MVLLNDRKIWSKMPSDAEFTSIETVVAGVSPLSVFTDALSGENVSIFLQYGHCLITF